MTSEPEPIHVALTEEFAGEVADAAQEAAYLLAHAANIFGLVHDGVAGGQFDARDNRLGSLAEVCGRAFRDMANKEGELLDQLGREVRDTLAQRLEARRRADLFRQQQEASRDHHD